MPDTLTHMVSASSSDNAANDSARLEHERSTVEEGPSFDPIFVP